MKAFPFFKPPNQVKHALFYIRITLIRIARLGVTFNVYKNCEAWCNLRMI